MQERNWTDPLVLVMQNAVVLRALECKSAAMPGHLSCFQQVFVWRDTSAHDLPMVLRVLEIVNSNLDVVTQFEPSKVGAGSKATLTSND